MSTSGSYWQGTYVLGPHIEELATDQGTSPARSNHGYCRPTRFGEGAGGTRMKPMIEPVHEEPLGRFLSRRAGGCVTAGISWATSLVSMPPDESICRGGSARRSAPVLALVAVVNVGIALMNQLPHSQRRVRANLASSDQQLESPQSSKIAPSTDASTPTCVRFRSARTLPYFPPPPDCPARPTRDRWIRESPRGRSSLGTISDEPQVDGSDRGGGSHSGSQAVFAEICGWASAHE